MLKPSINIIRRSTSAFARFARHPLTQIINAMVLLGISVLLVTVTVNRSAVNGLSIFDLVALFLAVLALVGGVLGAVLASPRVKNVFTAALGDEFCHEVIGDLEEIFLREREVLGDFRARLRFRRALLSVIVRRFWRSVVRLALRGRA